MPAQPDNIASTRHTAVMHKIRFFIRNSSFGKSIAQSPNKGNRKSRYRGGCAEITGCLHYLSLPLGEGGFSNLPLKRANWKRRMRAFLALNLPTCLCNRFKEAPHQSPQSVPKSRLWRQLPPGEAFGRYRASACKQQLILLKSAKKRTEGWLLIRMLSKTTDWEKRKAIV